MRRNAGFTLIEVIVALTIGAVVVLLAERLFATVSDAGQELAVARKALDRETNAHRWLAATFLSLEVGPQAGPFEGHPAHVAFLSWQEAPGGWFERHQVTLGRVGDRLVAAVVPGDSIVLAYSVTDLGFDYLLEPGGQARWLGDWVSGTSAPVAVRLRLARAGAVDTLLFLIKERG